MEPDRRRFEALARAYRPLLLQIARKLCGQGGIDPEDLVQESLERALQRFAQLGGESDGAFKAWLCTTLSNRFIDHCRRRRTEVMGLPGLRVVQDDVVSPEPGPRQLWETVTEEELRMALERVKPNHREAYELHAAGLRYKEIGLRMGVPQGTVGHWIYMARQELRALLAPDSEEEKEKLP